MSETDILGITELESNQAQAEVTVNEGFQTLERASNAIKEWTVVGDFTASKAEMAEGFVHELNGAPASPFAFGIFAGPRVFAVNNLSGQICTVYVQGQSGSGIAVSDDAFVLLSSDGVNITQVGGSSSGSGTFSGASIKFGSTPAAANYTGAGAFVPFDTEIEDEGGWFSAGTPGKFTVPAGVSRAQLHVNLRLTSITSGVYAYVQFRKNGSEIYNGAGGQQYDAAGTGPQFNVGTIPFPVVPGDILDVLLIVETDTTVVVDGPQSNFGVWVP